MYLDIPVRSDLPAFQYAITLEQAVYRLGFRFNQREGIWLMDVLTQASVPLVTGAPILVSLDILAPYQVEGLPPGNFFAEDTSGLNIDPGASDLGNRVLLHYRESGTVDG